MGFAITWLACPEERAEELLKQLALSSTGETDEGPDCPISMLRVKSGWRVVWFNEYGCTFLGPDQLAKQSKGTEVVLWIMSFVMLGSMHAVRFNHLQHHKDSLGDHLNGCVDAV